MADHLFVFMIMFSVYISFSNPCGTDADCGFDFCNKTNDECQCRFGKDEIDRKKCNEPSSCTALSDCVNIALQNCTNNKCICKFGYRGGTSECKSVNECKQDLECSNVSNAICVKGFCVCKHALPDFEVDGTLKNCNTSTFKTCSYDNSCPNFQECSRRKCRCKYGSIKENSGKFLCKAPHSCEENGECPEHGFCSQETKTCECKKTPAADVGSEGQVTKCEKDSMTAGTIAAIVGGCLGVALFIAVLVVFYFVDKRRKIVLRVPEAMNSVQEEI